MRRCGSSEGSDGAQDGSFKDGASKMGLQSGLLSGQGAAGVKTPKMAKVDPALDAIVAMQAVKIKKLGGGEPEAAVAPSAPAATSAARARPRASVLRFGTATKLNTTSPRLPLTGAPTAATFNPPPLLVSSFKEGRARKIAQKQASEWLAHNSSASRASIPRPSGRTRPTSPPSCAATSGTRACTWWHSTIRHPPRHSPSTRRSSASTNAAATCFVRNTAAPAATTARRGPPAERMRSARRAAR